MKITDINPSGIILASASPRRAALLRGLGWNFTVAPADVDEFIIEGEAPEETAARLASAKAGQVERIHPKALGLAADTLVVCDDVVLGKPRDMDDAFSMLRLLSGRKHRVVTGVAVWWNGKHASGVESTIVEFRELSDAAIRTYLDGNESMDKAGAYAIQDLGSLLVRRIEGCYFNVVGLPLALLSELLAETGVPVEYQWGMGSC